MSPELARRNHHTLDAAGTGGDVTFGYSYNTLNERTAQSISAAAYRWSPGVVGTSSLASSYGPVNQLAVAGGRAFAHDANGNLSQGFVASYGWDAKNRMVAAANSRFADIAYGWDARGLRVAQRAGGVETRHLYDGGAVVGDYDGASHGLVQRYVYGLGLAPVAVVAPDGVARFLHSDALGSVVAVTNAAGAVAEAHGYGPWGEGIAASDVPFRFTGHRHDPATGLVHMRARQYDPATGRFLSMDPIGFGDGLNLYRPVPGQFRGQFRGRNT